MEEEEDNNPVGSGSNTTNNMIVVEPAGQHTPPTPNTAVSTMHQQTMTSLPGSEDRFSLSSATALLATPKRKSLELDQQEKFPDVLVEHARLLDPHSGSSKRISLRSHDRTSSNQDPIEEKSEAEEEEDEKQQQQRSMSSSAEQMNMLFGCITEVVECKSEKEHHEKDSVTFYSHQSGPMVSRPQDFSSDSTEKESKEGMEMRQIEEELHLQNNLPEIICRCALFWRRQNCTTEDYRKFARLLGDYVELRMKPKPLNEVGERLLRNGFFVLAFIKYISMPESLEEREACEEAMSIQDNLFELFRKEYPLQTNWEDFEQAYNQNCRKQTESRLRRISISPPSPANTRVNNSLKRHPDGSSSPHNPYNAPSTSKIYQQQNKIVNEKKSVKSGGKPPSIADSQDQGVQTERD